MNMNRRNNVGSKQRTADTWVLKKEPVTEKKGKKKEKEKTIPVEADDEEAGCGRAAGK